MLFFSASHVCDLKVETYPHLLNFLLSKFQITEEKFSSTYYLATFSITCYDLWQHVSPTFLNYVEYNYKSLMSSLIFGLLTLVFYDHAADYVLISSKREILLLYVFIGERGKCHFICMYSPPFLFINKKALVHQLWVYKRLHRVPYKSAGLQKIPNIFTRYKRWTLVIFC